MRNTDPGQTSLESSFSYSMSPVYSSILGSKSSVSIIQVNVTWRSNKVLFDKNLSLRVESETLFYNH
jgi:hypothetical protein